MLRGLSNIIATAPTRAYSRRRNQSHDGEHSLPGNEKPLKVLYFGVRDERYPRNERIRRYLEDRLGAEVVIVHAVPEPSRIHRVARALAQVLQLSGRYDVVILSEFSLTLFPFSWLAAKRVGAAHLVDFFVGLYETEVGDAKSTSPRSVRAGLLALVDFLAVRSADACFTDTRVRAERFGAICKRRVPFGALPVGAPTWAIPRRSAPALKPGENSRLLYYGSYLPLHGLEVLIESVAGMEVVPEITMIGRGPTRDQAEILVRQLGLSDYFHFIDYAEPTVLAHHISNSDVVLGIFGHSDKAAEVIANKVWQGLYSSKIVVTRSSSALEELSEVAGPYLVQVDSGNPAEISAALTAAVAESRRLRLSDTQRSLGHDLESLVRRRFEEVFTSAPFCTIFKVQ